MASGSNVLGVSDKILVSRPEKLAALLPATSIIYPSSVVTGVPLPSGTRWLGIY